MSSNKSLVRTQKALAAGDFSSQELYTRYNDIANELSHYSSQLVGKRILCPCDWDVSGEDTVEKTYTIRYGKLYETALLINRKLDDTTKKEFWKGINWKRTKNKVIREITDKTEKPLCNFWKYLINQMLSGLNIKSVTFSGYNPKTKQGIPFECQDYSKFDIIITNPPFSLSKELVDLLIKNKKKFLIISSKMFGNSADASKYISTNKMWLGYNMPSKYVMPFLTHKQYETLPEKEKKSIKWDNQTWFRDKQGCYVKSVPAYWYTNMDVEYRHDFLVLDKKYHGNEKFYKKLDNFEGIYIDKTEDIPGDYNGLMAVPVSFLTMFNPDQFEIVGGYEYWKRNWIEVKRKFPVSRYPKMNGGPTAVVNGERKSGRYVIRNKKPMTKLTKEEEDKLW